MIKLTVYPSHNVYTYKTKTNALKEVSDNGFKPYEYTLEDTSNGTVYKQGLWLHKQELELLENGYSIKLIKAKRKHNKNMRR